MSQLDTLLATYSLNSIVHFPASVQNGSVSATDNIFINVTKNENYSICPLINGLSDCDAQIIKLNNFGKQGQCNETQIIRNFNTYSITNFKIKLRFETWDIFEGDYINIIFNNLLNTYLKILYASSTKKNTG
jgi:hypothetical protein